MAFQSGNLIDPNWAAPPPCVISALLSGQILRFAQDDSRASVNAYGVAPTFRLSTREQHRSLRKIRLSGHQQVR